MSGESILPPGDKHTNSLQFEKILAVGLPERFDRRDTLIMTATINDIELEWMDAVKGSEMNRKAWPAVCGCWCATARIISDSHCYGSTGTLGRSTEHSLSLAMGDRTSTLCGGMHVRSGIVKQLAD